MDIGLAVTVVIAVAGATWALRSKLSSIENTMTALVARVRVVEGKVIKLESRLSKRR